MDKLLINAIYRATEGEGISIGVPRVFVRFQGCSLQCCNCDSKYTWEFDSACWRNTSEVLDEIYKLADKVKNVSLTGGEPLHPQLLPQAKFLAQKLKEREYFVNLETAGTVIDEELFDLVDYISFDYKTPSSGIEGNVELIIKMNKKYPRKFQVKSVIENKEDFGAVLDAYDEVADVAKKLEFPWCLTPAYNEGESFPQQRFADILRWNEEIGGYFRVIGQQHKWIFGASLREV